METIKYMVKATIEPRHEDTLWFESLHCARRYIANNKGEDNYFELYMVVGNPEIYIGNSKNVRSSTL